MSQPSGSAATSSARATRAAASRGCAGRMTGASGTDDDSASAATRVSSCGQASIRPELHGGGAAEVQVPAPPAHDVVAAGLELVEHTAIRAALAVDVPFFEVHP